MCALPFPTRAFPVAAPARGPLPTPGPAARGRRTGRLVASLALLASLGGCSLWGPGPGPGQEDEDGAAAAPWCHHNYRGAVTACTEGPAPGPELEALAKQFRPQPGVAVVILMRQGWSDAGAPLSVAIDGGRPHRLLPGSFIRVRVKPGDHRFTLVPGDAGGENAPQGQRVTHGGHGADGPQEALPSAGAQGSDGDEGPHGAAASPAAARSAAPSAPGASAASAAASAHANPAVEAAAASGPAANATTAPAAPRGMTRQVSTFGGQVLFLSVMAQDWLGHPVRGWGREPAERLREDARWLHFIEDLVLF